MGWSRFNAHPNGQANNGFTRLCKLQVPTPAPTPLPAGATHSPTSAPTQACAEDVDFNYAGSNIEPNNWKTDTACECGTLCSSKSNALGFSWVDPASYVGNVAYHKNCHCKTAITKVSATGVMSGAIQAPTPVPTLAPTHSPTHAPTSMTAMPTPTPTPLPTESDGWDHRLAAYWDNGECGPHGDNYNWEWCGRWSFNCSDTGLY